VRLFEVPVEPSQPVILPPHARGSGLAGATGAAFLAVAIFALTLPVTRYALRDVGVMTVAFGRAFVGGLCALFLLRARLGELLALGRSQPKDVALAVGGTIIGFPLLVALAMRGLPSGHGALVIALIPFCMSLYLRAIGRERPGPIFWALSVLATVLVAAHAWFRGGGSASHADAGYQVEHLFLVGASMSAAIGYTHGGILARGRSGLDAMGLCLIGCLPLTLAGLIACVTWLEPIASVQALLTPGWLGVAYLGLFPQFLGFKPWYYALNVGGMARMGQMQLLQPFLTLAFAAAFLGEALGALDWFAAFGVAACVWAAKRAEVKRREE
jgi:drug/metabolite transporter (DMT)-like permease